MISIRYEAFLTIFSLQQIEVKFVEIITELNSESGFLFFKNSISFVLLIIQGISDFTKMFYVSKFYGIKINNKAKPMAF